MYSCLGANSFRKFVPCYLHATSELVLPVVDNNEQTNSDSLCYLSVQSISTDQALCNLQTHTHPVPTPSCSLCSGDISSMFPFDGSK